MEKITIEIPKGKRAEWVNGVLTLIDETPKDITERVKTFKDAVKELGETHILVKEWKHNCNVTPDLEAFLKLRIICAALNEGWEPQFTEDERRWFPWHYLWTESELDEKSDEWKADRHLIMIGDKYQSEYAGFTCSNSGSPPLVCEYDRRLSPLLKERSSRHVLR